MAVRICAIAVAFALGALGVGVAPAAASGVGPTADSISIMGVSGGDLGYIRQNETSFWVCANNVQDPAGVKTVTMNVSAIGKRYPGYDLTKVPMTRNWSKTSTCPGFAYAPGTTWGATWASNNPLPEGTYQYSVTMTDYLGNQTTQTGSVIVDNTPPKALDVQSTNGGATVGEAEQGDSITYSFSEPLQSFIAPPGGRSVVVHITDAGSNDVLSVWNPSNTHDEGYMGSVSLGGDYVPATTTFGATGTPSTIAQSPTDPTKVIVTLGTPSGPTNTVTGVHQMVWSTGTGAFDRAGNHEVAGTVYQSNPSGPAF
ncbi:MAG: hypothetical protein JOZ25_08380 [Actinobacteria bacterium]|nr:hypothetical protein [Actinomycetota bacterium]